MTTIFSSFAPEKVLQLKTFFCTAFPSISPFFLKEFRGLSLFCFYKNPCEYLSFLRYKAYYIVAGFQVFHRIADHALIRTDILRGIYLTAQFIGNIKITLLTLAQSD